MSRLAGNPLPGSGGFGKETDSKKAVSAIALYDKHFLKDPKKSSALLNKYLDTAVRLTNSDTMIGANRFLSDFATRLEWQKIDRHDVDARYKENKEKLKKFSFKDRAAYYANVKANDEGKEAMIKLGAVMAVTAVAAAVSVDLGRVVGSAGAVYLGSKMAAGTIGSPKNPKELFSTRDYADLKHEQIALRKLYHHLEGIDRVASRRLSWELEQAGIVEKKEKSKRKLSGPVALHSLCRKKLEQR